MYEDKNYDLELELVPKEKLALDEGNMEEENLKEDEGRNISEYERKIDELKNEVKALKALRKKQEKIEKLEEKKREILRDIEIKQEYIRRKKEKKRKKRKG